MQENLRLVSLCSIILLSTKVYFSRFTNCKQKLQLLLNNYLLFMADLLDDAISPYWIITD